MLKLPKGLKKKKKKSKKDQELFTEEELEEYKRNLKAKQEAAAAKSDAGESDASDVEGLTASASASASASAPSPASASTKATAASSVSGNHFQAQSTVGADASNETSAPKSSALEDEEWAKFKALTSGVDSILHKTQDELDRIKKESFFQRLPSAAEKKRLEEEEAARREAERLEEERRLAAEREAQRDKLAEAVVQLSDSESEAEEEVGDIFATDYIEAITSGEVQLAVVPDSPVLEVDEGPDPFDTAYAEKIIVGADKAKGNKKLVSLGAAVEVLSGRVDREHALALAKPKRKLRKGIQNLLLSESVDLADSEAEITVAEPQKNLLDELVDDIPEADAPIDLSVSLHLQLIKQQQPKVDEQGDGETEAQTEFGAESSGQLDLSEFDTFKEDEDDEFAELAVESLAKKDEVKVITEVPRPHAEVLTDITAADWAEFGELHEEQSDKPKRPQPPARPAAGPHLVPGAIYISDDENEADDDPFNTAYAEQVIKKTTVLEEDDDFDPRAEEKAAPPPRPAKPPPPVAHIAASGTRAEDFDPFDTTAIGSLADSQGIEASKLKQSLSDPDFDPRAEESQPAQTAQSAQQTKASQPVRPPPPQAQTQQQSSIDFDTARRKSSLSLNIHSKTVGFLVPDQDLLGAAIDGGGVRKPLTPYYAPTDSSIGSIVEKEVDADPFDTSYVPDSKPTAVELKHLEKDLLAETTATTLQRSLSDPDFDPRAPPTPVPAEDLLSVREDITAKVLTPAQESKDLTDELAEADIDPFDTSIAANLQPGRTELKLLESELLPPKSPDITTGVLDTQTDAQELGLGDKVLTPQLPHKQFSPPVDIDPFDTSIAENLAPGETEIKLLESELIERR